jgi:hypothetical protein
MLDRNFIPFKAHKYFTQEIGQGLWTVIMRWIYEITSQLAQQQVIPIIPLEKTMMSQTSSMQRGGP